MAKKHTTEAGTKIVRGAKMTPGRGRKLMPETGGKRAFKGTLLKTPNIGDVRLAIFSVPK
jgi:hypothetical protein